MKKRELLFDIDGRLYTIREITQLTGFSRNQIYNWVKRGYFETMIPSIKRKMEAFNDGHLRSGK